MLSRRPLALALALALSAGAAPAYADVAWRTAELRDALGEAQTAHKLVLVDFFAVWCGPCQAMDGTVWNRSDVAAAAGEGFVALRVDADTPTGIALRRQYAVGALPTVLALRADGTEVDRLVGSADSQTVLAAMASWRAGRSTLEALIARLRDRPDDLALHLDVGTRYADSGVESEATAHLGRVVQGDPQNERGLAAQAMLALGDRLYLRSVRAPERAVAPLEELIRCWPATESAAHAYVPLATAYLRTNQLDQARTVIDRYLDGAPPGTLVARANAAAWMMFRERWDLERAEQIALRGVHGAPQDDALAALLDTLAEIVFDRGRGAEAVRWEQQAARLDPGSEYYGRQIRRFQAGTGAATPTPRHESPPARDQGR